MSDTQTKDTKVIEVDDQVIDEVAAKATEAVEKTLSEKIAEIKVPTADEIADAMITKTEKVDKKAIHDDNEEAGKTDAKRTLKTGFDALSKERKFTRGVLAAKRGDAVGLAEYNDWSLKEWREKADYQNVTTAADGGALVPDPEFIAEIERLTDEYGVASRLCDVRRTDRDSVTLLAGTNEVSFNSASEATAVNAQKLTYSATTAALLKYIATLVMTSELIEDSAIDIWTDASNEIARARAKLFDNLVFTDATYGLLYAPDSGEAYKTHSVGTAITDFSFDDAMTSAYKVVSSARRAGRFFMHPTVWNTLRQTKTGDAANSAANYYAGPPLQAPVPTIDGYPVELVDVLPATGEITANEPFAVFGDLNRIKLHVKRLLETKVFDSGVVKDAGGADINLITQDSWAMRATLRCIPQTRFPGAFVILGTGTVS